jgi:putative Ca2+/H+ antiporter (TMEM165/GDT1 family)
VAEFESSSSGKKKPFASLLEVAGLIFLAEWGDRSMLATIALGAAQVGECMGGCACTKVRADPPVVWQYVPLFSGAYIRVL